MVLVEKITSDMYFYIHTVALSTWSHVGGVQKNPYATPKQKPKNVAKPKSNRCLKQSCGEFKTAAPT